MDGSVLFNAANNSMKDLFERNTTQNVLWWRIRATTDFVAGTGGSAFEPIKLNPSTVDTSSQIRTFVGHDLTIPDPTTMSIQLPVGYESLYGIVNARIKKPADNSGTSNVYMRAYLYNGIDYANKVELGTAYAYSVEHGFNMPMLFFDGYRHIETGQTGFKLQIETCYGAIFDALDLLLVVNQYGRQF